MACCQRALKTPAGPWDFISTLVPHSQCALVFMPQSCRRIPTLTIVRCENGVFAFFHRGFVARNSVKCCLSLAAVKPLGEFRPALYNGEVSIAPCYPEVAREAAGWKSLAGLKCCAEQSSHRLHYWIAAVEILQKRDWDFFFFFLTILYRVNNARFSKRHSGFRFFKRRFSADIPDSQTALHSQVKFMERL